MDLRYLKCIGDCSFLATLKNMMLKSNFSNNIATQQDNLWSLVKMPVGK